MDYTRFSLEILINEQKQTEGNYSTLDFILNLPSSDFSKTFESIVHNISTEGLKNLIIS